MNRFRTRKKAKDIATGNGESEMPSTPGFFKKNRKGVPEAKPLVETPMTLPSSDDFRTSLLMPNLSARFSMLREQDDPTSKIGKANDDSVLFPKRASRLNLFTHNPLADIAEVTSMRGSIRPPFAQEGRTNSYASMDGYGTDDDSQAGSIMSRSKPGEGNNLFGGRQKIYKIPMGESSSSRDLTSPTTPNFSGKAVYENDVTLSAFQRLKQQEREEEQRRLEHEEVGNHEDVDHEDPEFTSSPMTGFSKNRGTSSSTTSGPSNKRTSTAATSVDSQAPAQFTTSNSSPALPHATSNLDRNGTKTRRMYGHGLDQTMATQQPSAISRLESLNRHRAGSPMSPSKSMGNLNEKYQKATPVYTSAAFRTASPLPSVTPPNFGPMDTDMKESGPQLTGSNQGFGFVPPLSPPISETEDATAFVNAVQPEDRGKATALGLFNKPSKQYDEQQFSQRQVQMHEGRNTPSGERPSLPNTKLPEAARPRNESQSSYSSRADSLARRQTEELLTGSRHEFGRSDSRAAASKIANARLGKPSTSQSASEGTFLETLSDPNSDAEDETTTENSPSPQSNSPLSGVHPALRPASPLPEQSPNPSNDQGGPGSSEAEESPAPAGPDIAPTVRNIFEFASSPQEEQALDSPTLGPGLGLNGLIRTHLRTDSDKSSILPPPSPTARSISRFPEDVSMDIMPHKGARSFNQPESTHSNPWEFDDMIDTNDGPKIGQTQAAPTNNLNPMSLRARQMLRQATALKQQQQQQELTKSQETLGEEAPQQSEDSTNGRSWQDEMRARHNRGGSTETQKEREDFSNELAERRRKVQESLKTFSDGDSRSSSPMPNIRKPENNVIKQPHPFAMLRKTSRTNLTQNPEPSQASHSKAMKMLGIGNATMSSTSPVMGGTSASPQPPQDELWREEEERMLRDFKKAPKRTPHLASGGQPFHKTQMPQRSQPSDKSDAARDHLDEARDYFNSQGPSPPSSKSSRRDRSSSDVSGRSKSRNGRYRDDLEQAMAEGTGSISRGFTPEQNGVPKMPIGPRPSLDTVDSRPSERSSSAASGRFRGNSRQATAGYFDNKTMLPIQTNNPALIGLSPRPSPVTPYSANSTPPLAEASPTITMSTPGTPTLVPPTSYNDAIRSANLASRKKSVNKALISEPTFLSGTYSVSTVPLPPGASLSNGSGSARDSKSPPIPPMNPRRRRQTNTPTIFSAFGRSEKAERPASPASPFPFPGDERSTFSDEGDKRGPKPRQKLHKSSSEGGNLNAKARQQAMMVPSPAVPQFPQHLRAEGGMF